MIGYSFFTAQRDAPVVFAVIGVLVNGFTKKPAVQVFSWLGEATHPFELLY
jgi:hypothetical protein